MVHLSHFIAVSRHILHDNERNLLLRKVVQLQANTEIRLRVRVLGVYQHQSRKTGWAHLHQTLQHLCKIHEWQIQDSVAYLRSMNTSSDSTRALVVSREAALI